MDTIAQHLPHELLRQSEAHYRALFNLMDEAYCVIEVLFDADGKADDYRFLEVDPAFGAMTGWHHAVGRRVRELIPDHEAHWFDIYGKVVTTGEPIRFVQQANVPGARWFNLYAFRLGAPADHKVAVRFADITEARIAADALAIVRTELDEIIDLTPSFVVVFRGPEFIIEVANDAYRRLVGQRDLIGLPMRDAFPEVEGQGVSNWSNRSTRRASPGWARTCRSCSTGSRVRRVKSDSST